jgi:hypothetical protein
MPTFRRSKCAAAFTFTNSTRELIEVPGTMSPNWWLLARVPLPVSLKPKPDAVTEPTGRPSSARM